MNDAVLEIEGLTVRSAEGDALVKNVGLCLKRQECLGIAGESGSGKTITAKAILHLLPQDLTASVTHLRVLGEDLLNLPEKERRIFLGKKIGFVPQNTVAYLHPLIKIKNQLTDGYHIHFQTSKKAAQERAKTLLDRVGISDVNRVMESYPAQISGGMRQRVNIAMALMCEPQVIIADEPTTALDCVVKQQVIELFHSINEQQHVAIIMISHDLNLIRRYCDKVAVMYAGQIVESGGSNEVFSQPQHPYTQALLSVIPRLDQDRNVRLNEIPGYVPEHGRDTSHCLFQPRCSACRQECGGSVKSSRRDGHFVRCSKAWEECRA
jgi:oligopeptide/dipeptide ABC transporter ATP-binding protein